MGLAGVDGAIAHFAQERGKCDGPFGESLPIPVGGTEFASAFGFGFDELSGGMAG